MASTVSRNTAPRARLLGRPRFREIRPSGPRARNASSRRYICLRPTPISPVASATDRRPSAISINTRRRLSSLRLIVITVIPRHLDEPHADCRGYRGLVRLGLSLVDTDGLSPPGAWSAASSDHIAEYAHVVATCDLSGLLGSEAAAQHRRDEVPPLRVVWHATRPNMLVGADADMIDPDDVGHLLQTVDVFLEAREEVPDADRPAGLGDRPCMVGADLPPAQWGWAHRPRPEESSMRQQQGFRRDFDRLVHHVLGRVRNVADKPQSMTFADHLGAE